MALSPFMKYDFCMDNKKQSTVPLSASEIAFSVKNHLAYLQELGLAGIEKELIKQKREEARGKTSLPQNEADEKDKTKGKKTLGKSLEQISADIGDCKLCPLHEGRTNIVFGVGNPNARIMFIGEGPGADEDAQGIPFVGRAGKLLTKIIESGMNIKRDDVYIANIVKCRPPGNRDPEPGEREACMPFLEEQIKSVSPEVIIALGRVPAQTLLDTKTPIGKLRGIWTERNGFPFMPTFHPSYLLRNPSAKREVWEDIKLVMEKLKIPIEEDM
jgi:uracil-DNA glycosylase